MAFLLSTMLLITLCACGNNAKKVSESDASESDISESEVIVTEIHDEGTAADLRDPEWYQKMDGSTACIPLANLIVRRMTGCDEEIAAINLKFNTTNYAISILDGTNKYVYGNTDKDIALVYESADLLENQAIEYYPIGSDGLVFLVNANNPVESISVEQARDIYSGKITNWKELGGENKPIIAYNRDAESGSGYMMEKLVMKGTSYKDFPEEFVEMEMSGLVSAIADYRNEGNAIGYSVYYYVKNMYYNPDIKLLKIDGVEPSIPTISSREYTLTNDFYVAIRKSSSENSAARVLMNWILSNEGNQTVIDAGYAGK